MKKMTYAAAQMDTRFQIMSEGNKKLEPTKDTKYLIWNIPAIITCPGRTDHCEYYCYAVKAEKQYPDCLPSRMRKYAASMKSDFVENMIFTLKAHMDRPSYKAAKKVVVRIHESGDFYSQGYFDKWLAIAAAMSDYSNLVFMAYTKSVWFVHDVPSNMVIRFSLWDDTNPDDYAMAQAKSMPVYTAVEKFTTEPEKNKCHCENCSTCHKCWAAIEMIMCEIH